MDTTDISTQYDVENTGMVLRGQMRERHGDVGVLGEHDRKRPHVLRSHELCDRLHSLPDAELESGADRS
jgi:hypothetical protein